MINNRCFNKTVVVMKNGFMIKCSMRKQDTAGIL